MQIVTAFQRQAKPLPPSPWNRGKQIGQKLPLKAKEVWAIRTHLQVRCRIRDLALFNLGIDSKLRGCDLLKLLVRDVAPSGSIRQRATVLQQKTGRCVTFEITATTRSALTDWLAFKPKQPGDFLFSSLGKQGAALTTRQYGRLVKDWVSLVGLDPSDYGTHSIRRTKAAAIYRQTGNLRAVQILLGHSKLESTVRYLGIDVEDAIALSEQADF
jgi:site-specific recombinase XerC